MDSLECANAAQCSLHLQDGLLTQVASTDGYLCSREEGGFDVVIAVHTDDFFCDIRVILHVLAVCREVQGQLVAVDFRLEV